MQDRRLPQEKRDDERYNIPVCLPTFTDMAEQMRINADFIMKEISDHVDKEIERFNKSIKR